MLRAKFLNIQIPQNHQIFNIRSFFSPKTRKKYSEKLKQTLVDVINRGAAVSLHQQHVVTVPEAHLWAFYTEAYEHVIKKQHTKITFTLLIRY